VTSLPLDDDQLADRANIRPRQTVNQICRALQSAGVLRRSTGPDGKIVNELVRPHQVESDNLADEASVARETLTEPVREAAHYPGVYHALPPGSSREQRDAERLMLDLLATRLCRALEPTTITVPCGARVEVDGADADRTVLVECWAHQGPPKAAQRHKVLSDAFKLTWISSTIYPRPKLILCLSDTAAAAPFLPGARSWAARALGDLAIAVTLVDLPDDVRSTPARCPAAAAPITEPRATGASTG
jgi:hypothetical protein